MSIKIRIPTPLQKLTGNLAEVEGEGKSVGEVLENLESSYPGFRERLFDEKDQLRRFINFFLNGEDIRFQEGVNTLIKEGDELSIVPAIAGG